MSLAVRRYRGPALAALCLAAAALASVAPARAQATAETVAADLRMAQDSAPYRLAADAFVERAMAGDAKAALAMLSPALVARSGDAAIRRALDQQILPFFQQGRAPGRSVTIAGTTDAAGQRGFAFYMWMEPTSGTQRRPFAIYVVEEQHRLVIANVVPDRLVEGRHR